MKYQYLIILVIFFFLLTTANAQENIAPGVTTSDLDAIQAQVTSLLDSSYQIKDIVNVDSAIGNRFVADGSISNPYNTLTHSYIFVTRQQESDSLTLHGTVGIYKNGSVVWQSNPSNLNATFTIMLSISAVRDLNYDGKVDIITSWFGGATGDIEYLWIFDWDGQSGNLISAVDSTNESVLVSVASGFECVDVNGDNIFEIEGDWYENTSDELTQKITYSWNGSYYGKWDSPPQPLPSGFYPRDKVDPEVKSIVRNIGAKFSYGYKLQSLSSSKQAINTFVLVTSPDSIENGASPTDWVFGGFPTKALGWLAPPGFDVSIKPGLSDSSFYFESNRLPGIVQCLVRGDNGNWSTIFGDTIEYTLEQWLDEAKSNSFIDTTIGPKDPPLPFEGLNFLDTIRSYTTQSRTLGWITEQSTAGKYTTLFDSAKSQLQRNAIIATRITLDTILANANRDSSSTLSSEAYALIYFNTEYLLNQLPTPPPQYNLNINTIGNGTVTKSPELALYDSATTVTLTPIPATGYKFSGWSGSVSDTTNPINVVMNGNKNITATFTQNVFVITATAGANGSISPSGEVSVTYGENQSFAITSNTGYHVDSVIVDGAKVDSTTSYTFTNVTTTHTITAKFAINIYTLTVNATNGTVTKTPDQPTYNHGTSVQLTATPATGYHFVNWTGDTTTATTPITLTMNANKTVTANFAINTYTISSSTGSNGSISPLGAVTVNHGVSQTYMITPITGYHVDSLFVDGVKITSANSHTFTNVTANHTIRVVFAINKYTLTVQIVNVGRVTKSPNLTSYTHGTSVTLTAINTGQLKVVPNTPLPVSGTFDHWEVDATGTTNPITIVMDRNKTVRAVFVP